jgi:hypothetical protein
MGVGAPLVMGVNATDFAEVMTSRIGVELIQTKGTLPLHNGEVGKVHGNHDGPTPPAIGTITAAGPFQAFWEFYGKLYSAAMAGRLM